MNGILDIDPDWSIFRLASVLFHVAALVLLLYKIIKTKSCSGISGRAQLLLALAFLVGYADLAHHFDLLEPETIFKVIILVCSLATVHLMFGKFLSTYDAKHDIHNMAYFITISIVTTIYFEYDNDWRDMLKTFSTHLEAIAILPQLNLIYNLGFTPYMKSYLITLGIYRFLQILDWIYIFSYSYYPKSIWICSMSIQAYLFLRFVLLYRKKNPQEVSQKPADTLIFQSILHGDIYVVNKAGLSVLIQNGIHKMKEKLAEQKSVDVNTIDNDQQHVKVQIVDSSETEIPQVEVQMDDKSETEKSNPKANLII